MQFDVCGEDFFGHFGDACWHFVCSDFFVFLFVRYRSFGVDVYALKQRVEVFGDADVFDALFHIFDGQFDVRVFVWP